jgi:ACS family hexuronate transporter-like MFS transporter
LPFLIIYIISDLGSIFFGWLATHFIGMGWSVNRARKTTMAHLRDLRGADRVRRP